MNKLMSDWIYVWRTRKKTDGANSGHKLPQQPQLHLLFLNHEQAIWGRQLDASLESLIVTHVFMFINSARLRWNHIHNPGHNILKGGILWRPGRKCFLEAPLPSGPPYVCIHSPSASLDVINPIFPRPRMLHSTVYHFWSLNNRARY